MQTNILFSLILLTGTMHISTYSMSEKERDQALEEARNKCDPSSKESREEYDQTFREIFKDFFENKTPYDLYSPDQEEQ